MPYIASKYQKGKINTPLTKSAVERKYKRPTAILLLNIFVFIIEIIISNNHNIIIIITK